MLKILISFSTIYILIKSISYGIYEKKSKKNKPGAITVIALGFIQLIFTNFTIYFLNR